MFNCDDKGVVGFVFKIQVNMDFNYCDCVVFLCFCLGEFKCGMCFKMVDGKQINVYNLMMFLV